jgi:uncharacterized oligopeptide transporter (OPT) family protein
VPRRGPCDWRDRHRLWRPAADLYRRGAPAGTDLADFVSGVFRAKIRFIGAGTIGVAAIWTLLRVIGPIVRGIAGAGGEPRARRKAAGLDLTERGTCPSALSGARSSR